MNTELTTLVEQAVQQYLDSQLTIASAQSVGGGCISDARIITLSDGRLLFLKTNASAPFQMFDSEAQGLRMLGQAKRLRVPQVFFVDQLSDGTSVLALEVIREGRRGNDYFADFGRQLAQLHLSSQTEKFGLDHSNFIGSTPQPNDWCKDWPQFFAEQRIGFQLRLAEKNGFSNSQLSGLGQRFVDRIPEYLATDESPSLIHGDLWSGNYLCDQNGRPVIIDPAVYYAHREAEFGMIKLFGGVDQSFYDAYQEVWPFADGYQDRFEIYELYHLLNHLNLFGSSYLSGCLSILSKFA